MYNYILCQGSAKDLGLVRRISVKMIWPRFSCNLKFVHVSNMGKWQKLKHDQNWAIVGQNAPGFCALAKGWPFKPLGTLGLNFTLLCNVQ